MKSWIRLLLSIVLLGMAQLLQAQPSRVPIYELAEPDARAASFGSIFNVRALSSGKVLVNDGTKLQLLLFDERLANPSVVVGNAAQVYGQFAAPIIPYRGDSTLFVDRVSRTLLLIDPDGRVVRAIAPVRASDIGQLSNHASGADNQGNLVYRGISPVHRTADGMPPPPIIADSVAILRANFGTRVVDTLTRFKLQPQLVFHDSKDANGKSVLTLVQNPWLEVDDWTVLSDGTVAVVRGNDYHIDFISPDKVIRSSARLPFDFRALSVAEKRHLVDSATAADSNGVGTLGTQKVYAEYIPASKLPDYYPSIREGAAKADLDANLWILPNTSAQSIAGELVYDVVNNQGVLLYRVRAPKGKSIAGFGTNGVVYLMSKDGTGWLLERSHIVKQCGTKSETCSD